MRFWLNRKSGRPLQQQIAAQLLYGILSGEYPPGKRLPSLRQLARLLGVHVNSVALVYRDLVKRGWVEARGGSGYFVGKGQAPGIESFVEKWVEAGAALGFSREQIITALQQGQPEKALVVDPDIELARIIAAEMSELQGRNFVAAGLEEVRDTLEGGVEVWCNPGQAGWLGTKLPGRTLRHIALRSIPMMLAGLQRPSREVLVGIVSRSETIRKWAGLLVPAFGIPADALLLRNPADAGWTEGLECCYVVAADVVAAREFPPQLTPHRLRIVAA